MNRETGLLQHSLKIIKFFATKRGTMEYEENKQNLLEDLLQKVKMLLENSESKPILQQKLLHDQVFNEIRQFLIDPKSQIRFNAIKLLRYLVDSTEIFEFYRKKHIPLFIARCLERDIKENKQSSQMIGGSSPQMHEVIQCIYFIRKWIEISPTTFPKLLANSLVAFTDSSDEQIKKIGIETIRHLAIANTQICVWSGGIKYLIDAVNDPALSDVSDSIIQSLLFLINKPQCRSLIMTHFDLSKLFAIFTDLDHPDPSKDRGGKNSNQQYKFEQQLCLSKRVIVTILKNWPGLIYLGYEKTALKSMIQALSQPINQKVRNTIFEILNEIFSFASQNIEKQNNKSDLTVQDLLNYYLIIFIQLVLDYGLYIILLELSGSEDPEIAKPSQKLLKDLNFLMHNFFPNFQKYSDFLICAAGQVFITIILILYHLSKYNMNIIKTTFILKNDEILVEPKTHTTTLLNQMGNFLFQINQDQTVKQKRKMRSNFIFLCENLFISNSLGQPNYMSNNETIVKIRQQLEIDIDDIKFKNLLKASMVEVHKEWQKWNWLVIWEIISNCLSYTNRFNEALKCKFLKKVLSFYFPSNRAFISMDWKPENFIYSKTGYFLIKLLVKQPEGRKLLSQSSDGFYKLQKSFFADYSQLIQLDKLNDTSNQISIYLNQENFCLKMVRELVSYIGIFSQSQSGIELLNNFKIFEYLIQLVDKDGKFDHVLQYIIFCLDYAKEGPAREFLEYCVENGSKKIVFTTLDQLLLLSELIDFDQWGLNIIVNQLQNMREIAEKALQILEEISNDPEQLINVIQKNPKILNLGSRGENYLYKMLSIKEGIDYLKSNGNWIDQELTRWKEKGNENYVKQVEKCLLKGIEYVHQDSANQGYKYIILNYLCRSLVWFNILKRFDLGNENAFYTQGFIQRLPFNLYCFYESNEFEGYLGMESSIDSFQNQEEFDIVSKPKQSQSDVNKNIQNKLIQRTILNYDSQFVIKIYMQIGRCFVDNFCQEINEQHYIRCDYNDKKHLGREENGQLIIEKNRVCFIFDLINQNQKIKLVQIRINVKIQETYGNNQQLPTHILGELVKTDEGLELIKEKKFIEEYAEILRNENSAIFDIRGVLWAIGNIGRSPNGIQLLIENDILKNVVSMAEKHPYLSLRGTCIYTINMLVQTKEGRLALEKFNWNCFNKFKSGWMCIPKDLNQFFNISYNKNEKTYWPGQTQVWNEYKSIIYSMPLNEDQIKIIDYFNQMGNNLIQRDARDELRKRFKQNNEIFMDRYLFFCVIVLQHTFFKFRYDIRRFNYVQFDKFLNSPNIFIIMDSNPSYNKFII